MPRAFSIRNLSTRTAALVAVSLLATAAAGAAAIVASWSNRRLLERIEGHELASVDAVKEVELALVDHHARLVRAVRPGRRPKTDVLDSREATFGRWTSRLGALGLDDDGRDLLAGVRERSRAYFAAAHDVIDLLSKGRRDRARAVLESRAEGDFEVAYELASRLQDTAENRLATESERGRRGAGRAGALVAATIATASVGALGLVWFLRARVYRPLRRLAEDDTGADEVDAVGRRLSRLRETVEVAEDRLIESRRQLESAERMAELGMLAAGVAHEIRNPLTAIRMRLFALDAAVGDDPDLRDDVRVVADEVGRLGEVVQDFLDYSRPSPPETRPESPKGLVESAARLLGPRLDAARIRLRLEGLSEAPRVLADADQVRQILLNLLENAIDAMPRGGELVVSGDVLPGADGVRAVRLRVADSGSGIPAPALRRVFEPYFSTKEHGVGLGLGIARRIAEMHGGRLEVEDTSSTGTTFLLDLPAAEEGVS